MLPCAIFIRIKDYILIHICMLCHVFPIPMSFFSSTFSTTKTSLSNLLIKILSSRVGLYLVMYYF